MTMKTWFDSLDGKPKPVPTPAWAVALINRICAERGIPVPDVTWRRLPLVTFTEGHRRNGDTVRYRYEHSEHASRGKFYFPSARHPNGHLIVECRRDDSLRPRRSVLHELSHAICGYKEAHSPEFYRTLFDLCEEFAGALLTPELLLRWERSYKPRNSAAGYRLWLNAKQAAA